MAPRTQPVAAMAPGTQPVAARHAFDTAALAAWLGANLDGFAGPLEVLQFAGGQSNPTFLLLTPQRNYVLRKQPPGVLLPSAHAIDREYRVLHALTRMHRAAPTHSCAPSGCLAQPGSGAMGSGVPVPQTLGYCADADIIGTPFYLMHYQPGRIFTNPLLPELAPAQRAQAHDAMNAVLARLHGVDWRAAGLSDFGKPERFIERQLARWSRQYAATRTDDVPAMERLRDWLAAHMPDDEQATIVHGDYRIGNLIYAPTEPAVAAVLDWELSTIGHPFSDLAFNCMTYHLPAGHPVSAGFVGADLQALGIPDEASYLASYARRSGRDPRPHWNFYMAFSLFRTAAIQQGVYARALKGNAASATAHLFGESYRMVANAGLRLAHT